MLTDLTINNKHNLLTDSQYGFRPNRSTSLAVIELIEKITNSLDQNNYAAGVFIDLKKAFDTINHERLINKLERWYQGGCIKLAEELSTEQATVCEDG